MAEFFISSNKYSLQERQTKRGKVYDVIFRVVTLDGEEKQKKLSGYINKTLAKQAYVDFVTERCELIKNNPLKKKTKEKVDFTIKELSLKYFSSIKNQVKDSSIFTKHNLFNLTVIPKFGNYTLKMLSKEILLEWQDEMWSRRNPRTDDFYSFKYLSNIRINFSAFLSWCSERYGTKNYLLEIKKPKRRQQKTEMSFWTKEEFETFISVVDNPMYHCLFMTMFYTGRRKGEIFALSTSDIGQDKIYFNKTCSRRVFDAPYVITSTKNEKTGATPICPALQNELHSYKRLDKGNFFFGGEHPIHENTVANNFKRYCKLANMKPIRIHDLRHSFVSMLIHLGANFTVIADLIGDTVEQVIKTYGHLYESDKIDIINRL